MHSSETKAHPVSLWFDFIGVWKLYIWYFIGIWNTCRLQPKVSSYVLLFLGFLHGRIPVSPPSYPGNQHATPAMTNKQNLLRCFRVDLAEAMLRHEAGWRAFFPAHIFSCRPRAEPWSWLSDPWSCNLHVSQMICWDGHDAHNHSSCWHKMWNWVGLVFSLSAHTYYTYLSVRLTLLIRSVVGSYVPPAVFGKL